MIKTCIIGASGYAGADLAVLIQNHPEFELAALYVSANSADAGKNLGDIHPKCFNQINLSLTPIDESNLVCLAETYDAIFLATPHEASHQWMPELTGKKAKIFDLSGAFRIKDKQVFEQFYGFAHTASDLLSKAVYGLADWHQAQIKQADLIAVPGCYPTASLTALKPLQNNQLLDAKHFPIINAVSGVSGAGRKAALGTSFTEVSLTAYGVLGHRHQPEISEYLGAPVIFTPHLGNFKRGILATITVKLQPGVSQQQIDQAYSQAYANNPIVRIRNTWPKIDDVASTPFCDLFWKYDAETGYLVVTSAIDNLLKGASSQAVQCANLRFGFEAHLGLTNGLVN
ncbi:N-acetyl-gamma-glutamyl-phosphate reductase [Paraglaciecola sp. L3A3]|uniref:N-acetyl-gamma-glutamyl-phosphate reductase n=1 Tax=Paraglaciecola sp. L3A3 TaxID=2686358 RepID=UPI00131B0B63|nr:N-acetyl-gamma-glutamyl-phosphate reductase [Paraglaciecola sp. L3A3]